ncbi:MAG: flagellar hook-associated protein FlgK [Acetobacteraceae bacterium]|nr:flagellar hook-associated protein FlgK [Acetobacteraceae bacterium]
MSIGSALSIATGGLAVVSNNLALVSQNVANANTPNYAVESATQTSLNAAGAGLGVLVGPSTRQIDTALQAEGFRQNATVAGLQTRQAALQAVDSAQGTPGQGQDLPSLLAAVQNQFSSLLNTPDNQTQQSAVIAAAGTLATGINALSTACTAQRQAAQDDIVSSVQTLNTALGTIGTLTNQIIGLRAANQSTADLENQRDAALTTVSGLVDVKVLNQPNGGIVLSTSGGLALPLTGSGATLTDTGANVQTGAYYPAGGIPGVTLNGTDVTAQLTGGRIGADLALRDATLPTYQGELDEFAETLATRFDAQGLTLFTDPTGALPVSTGTPVQTGYVGFAATIQVNPAVTANPASVRDGTASIAGSPTGASAFTQNPAGGPAGFTTLIQRVLTYALGTEAQSGVPQPTPNTTGLGPNGTLNAPYVAPASLSDQAVTMVASQSQDSADTTSKLATEQAVQTNINSRMTAISGVSMDTEMSTMIRLQNAYGANAKVIATTQALWSQLLAMVQ